MDGLYIGKKIQEFRSQRGFTMRELSLRSGITPSMLSQIERELVNPSINTLKALAKGLDVPLFCFFKDDGDGSDLVVRHNQHKTIGLPNQDVVYDLLTPNTIGPIEFCLMHIPSGSDSGGGAIQEHNGEEVAYILAGPVCLTLDTNTYILEVGDSVRIPAHTTHHWENQGDREALVIFAVTPPSF